MQQKTKKLSDKEIIKKTQELLLSNIQQGHNVETDKNYFYVAPSPKTYPYQWFWDTCFQIFILCSLGKADLAKHNLESLFALQDADGFVGHMLFWHGEFVNDVLTFVQARPSPMVYIPHMSSIIQPPLAAQAALRIYEQDKDRKFLKSILPKLKLYHRWLQENRNFDGDGLITIISPFESGMDHKPTFDEVLDFKHGIANELLFEKVLWTEVRNFLNKYNLKTIYAADYFLVKEVCVNTFYSLDLSALAKLCQEDQDEDAHYYTNQAKKVTNSMLKSMFDEKEKAFFDLYSKGNKKIKIVTPTIFFPAVLEDVPEKISKQIFEKHLVKGKAFAIKYPIPSVSVSDPSFNPNEATYLWRGPTWIIYNWMLYRSLVTKGFKKLGEQIYQSMRELIEKSGFREYYNPLTGEGYGAKNFTWSGLIVDMMRIRKELKMG